MKERSMDHKITLLEDDDYDLDDNGPDEIDFSKARVVRRGLPSSHPMANTVRVEPDILEFFKTPETINEALREVMNERQRAA